CTPVYSIPERSFLSLAVPTNGRDAATISPVSASRTMVGPVNVGVRLGTGSPTMRVASSGSHTRGRASVVGSPVNVVALPLRFRLGVRFGPLLPEVVAEKFQQRIGVRPSALRVLLDEGGEFVVRPNVLVNRQQQHDHAGRPLVVLGGVGFVVVAWGQPFRQG